MLQQAVDQDTGWQRGFQDVISSLAASRVRSALAEHRRGQGMWADINRLTILMLRVSEHIDDLDPVLACEFLASMLDIIVRTGAGAGFALTGEFLTSSRRIID